MIRADTKIRPYKNSLTLALSQRERGIGELISPASPIDKRTDMPVKMYAHIG